MFGAALRLAQTPATQPDPGYIAEGVRLAADIRRVRNTPSGVSDGRLGTFSCWYKRFGTGLDIIYQVSSSANLQIDFQSSGNGHKLRFTALQGTPDMAFETIGSQTVDSLWHHVMASWDRTTGTFHLYIDGVDDLNVITTGQVVTIDYTAGTTLGSTFSSAFHLNAELVDFWIDYTVAIDFSVAANRLKFISATGKPVFLGDNGELPLGGSPEVFWSGDLTAWETNKGTMGDFSDSNQGSFTNATSSPSG